jgi:hypothetical protein
MQNETQWVLVPREPTEAMLDAFAGTPFSGLTTGKQRAEREAYAAMLSAAPSPPAGGGEPVAWLWEEEVDPTGEVIHGKTIQRVAFHWSTPPKSAAVTPLYAHPPAIPDEIAALRERVREAVAAEREACAQVAYRICAETRHVTLGDKAADAIRARTAGGSADE